MHNGLDLKEELTGGLSLTSSTLTTRGAVEDRGGEPSSRARTTSVYLSCISRSNFLASRTRPVLDTMLNIPFAESVSVYRNFEFIPVFIEQHASDISRNKVFV